MNNRPSTEFGFLNREGFEKAVRELIVKVQQEKNRDAYLRETAYYANFGPFARQIMQLPDPPQFEEISSDPAPYEPDPVEVGPHQWVDRNDICGIVWGHLSPVILLSSGHEIAADRWKVESDDSESVENSMDDCMTELGWKK